MRYKAEVWYDAIDGSQFAGEVIFDSNIRWDADRMGMFSSRIAAGDANIPGKVEGVLSEMECIVLVEGSSPTTTQQPKAVAHAVANVLACYDRRLGKRLARGFKGVKVKREHRFTA